MILSRVPIRHLYRGLSSPLSPRLFTSSVRVRQVHPRGPYYDALMEQPAPSEYPLHAPIIEHPAASSEVESESKTTQSQLQPNAVSSSPTPESALASAIKEISITDRELGPEERAKLVFGSPLTGPERMANLRSQGATINGVFVPKKPEEPDNCCMSGCVNCVWEMYQEEMNEWQAAMKEAKAIGKAMDLDNKQALEGVVPPQGKGAVLAAEEEVADPFEGIPVGIRQFMATEKKIKVEKAEAEADSF